MIAALRDHENTMRPQRRIRRPHESITLTTREIITLTSMVAKDENVQIPAQMLSLLKSVICQRKRVAATYATMPTEKGSDRER